MTAKAAKFAIRPLGPNLPPYTIRIVGSQDNGEVLNTITGNTPQTLNYDPTLQSVQFDTLNGQYELSNTYTVTLEGGDGGHAMPMADKPKYTTQLSIAPTPGARQPHNPHYSVTWLGVDGLSRSAGGFAPTTMDIYDPMAFAFRGSTGTYDVTTKFVGNWSDDVTPPVLAPTANLLGLGGTTPHPTPSSVGTSHSWVPWLLLILSIIVIAYLLWSSNVGSSTGMTPIRSSYTGFVPLSSPF